MELKLVIMSSPAEVLVRGPEDLAEERQLVEETVEDIGTAVDEELEPLSGWKVRDDPLVPVRDSYSGETERDFEAEFERDEGGLNAGDMTSVLKMEPLAEEVGSTPVMYVTDRPLFARDRERDVEEFVYGVHQPGSRRNTAVLSSFPFQEMRPEPGNELLETVAYRQAGHLLALEAEDSEYGEEFGGEHCRYPDVMTGEDLWSSTRYRHESQVYCETCTEEIKEGIEELRASS